MTLNNNFEGGEDQIPVLFVNKHGELVVSYIEGAIRVVFVKEGVDHGVAAEGHVGLHVQLELITIADGGPLALVSPHAHAILLSSLVELNLHLVGAVVVDTLDESFEGSGGSGAGRLEFKVSVGLSQIEILHAQVQLEFLVAAHQLKIDALARNPDNMENDVPVPGGVDVLGVQLGHPVRLQLNLSVGDHSRDDGGAAGESRASGGGLDVGDPHVPDVLPLHGEAPLLLTITVGVNHGVVDESLEEGQLMAVEVYLDLHLFALGPGDHGLQVVNLDRQLASHQFV